MCVRCRFERELRRHSVDNSSHDEHKHSVLLRSCSCVFAAGSSESFGGCLLPTGYMTFDLGTLYLRRGTYARVLYPHHPSPNLLQ